MHVGNDEFIVLTVDEDVVCCVCSTYAGSERNFLVWS